MKKLLENYDKNKVDIFISYINALKTEKDKDGKLKNYWATKASDETFADLFKKEAEKGLYIDGESITLTFRGKVIVTYDYHAYINKVSLSYPESEFDYGIVYENDDFAFRKESGKVHYTHKINDPFSTTKKIIGAYGIIKNRKGEFIELLNMDDIKKMKATSKMKNIWDAWFDRMVLKSVIKRVCSVHFKDIVKDMEKTDNEQNDPDRATMDELLLVDIDNADTEEELAKIYNANKGIVKDQKAFIEILSKRKTEILEKNGTLS